MPQIGRAEGKVLAGGRYIEGAGGGTHPLLFEGTPPDGALHGAPVGARVVDVTTGTEYTNGGTAASPVWAAASSGPNVLYTLAVADNPDGYWDTFATARPASGIIGVRLTITPTAAPPAHQEVVMLFDEPHFNNIVAINIFADTDPTLTRFAISALSKDGNMTYGADSGTYPPDVPYVVEALHDDSGATPTIRLYVDGVEVATADDPHPEATPGFPWFATLASVDAVDGYALTALTVADGYQGV